MDIAGWEQRYRSQIQPEDLERRPADLVVEQANSMRPGRALDLACGTGRNALWLAEQGWSVDAMDGSRAAIEILQRQAETKGLAIHSTVTDLTSAEFSLPEGEWDLVLDCYYLQRDLFGPMKAAVTPGGALISIVHTTQGNEEPTESRLRPGELTQYFSDWTIVHAYEGVPRDSAHKRLVSEVVAIKPSL